MTHADTLRGMADGQPIPWDTPVVVVAVDTRQDALLAGAAALDTLDRVGDALTKIDRNGDAAEESARAFSDVMCSVFEKGRVDAYHHAHLLITRALGDVP